MWPEMPEATAVVKQRVVGGPQLDRGDLADDQQMVSDLVRSQRQNCTLFL